MRKIQTKKKKKKEGGAVGDNQEIFRQILGGAIVFGGVGVIETPMAKRLERYRGNKRESLRIAVCARKGRKKS